MSDHERLLGIAHEAVDKAVSLFEEVAHHELTPKGDRDYASETDYRIERELREWLAAKTPDVGFLGEEGGHTGGDGRWWCLDPIDGTVNYVHGNPLCGVSLALVEGDTPAIGVIDLPRLGDRYWAAPTVGAVRNRKPVRVSSAERVAEAVVSIGDFAVGAGASGRNRARLDVVEALAERALRLRMIGSAAADLAWVTEAKFDAAIVFGGHLWDLAAGTVLVREAGGVVVQSFHGGSDVAVAGPSPLAGDLLEIIASASGGSAAG